MTSRTIKIEGIHTCASVNLCLTLNEDCVTVVAISAWHIIDGSNILQREIVDIYNFDNQVSNMPMMERYIEDFSSATAVEFVKNFKGQ